MLGSLCAPINGVPPSNKRASARPGVNGHAHGRCASGPVRPSSHPRRRRRANDARWGTHRLLAPRRRHLGTWTLRRCPATVQAYHACQAVERSLHSDVVRRPLTGTETLGARLFCTVACDAGLHSVVAAGYCPARPPALPPYTSSVSVDDGGTAASGPWAMHTADKTSRSSWQAHPCIPPTLAGQKQLLTSV